MKRLGLLTLRCISGDCGEQKRQGRIDGVPGGARIGAELTTYLVNGGATESLLQHFE